MSAKDLRQPEDGSQRSGQTSPVGKLGRPENKKLFVGQHLELAISNFAEVVPRPADLSLLNVHHSPTTLRKGGRSALNFGIQAENFSLKNEPEGGSEAIRRRAFFLI